MCMLIYQTTVAGTLILRRSSTKGCLVWLLKVFYTKVVDLLWSWEARRTCACWSCCSLKCVVVSDFQGEQFQFFYKTGVHSRGKMHLPPTTGFIFDKFFSRKTINMIYVVGTCDFQSMLHSADSAEKSVSQNIRRHTPEDGSVPRERQTLKQPMCETTTPLRRIIGVKVNLHASTIRILRVLSVSHFCHQEKDPFGRRHIGHYSRSEPSSP